MNTDTETASPAAGSNDGDVNDSTTTCASDMRKSSSNNGGRGSGRGGHTRRGVHQGCCGRSGRFNRR